MSEIVRVAAVGDLHCSKASRGAFHPLFSHTAQAADLLLAGGLTHLMTPHELAIWTAAADANDAAQWFGL